MANTKSNDNFSTKKSMEDKTFAGVGSLIKLLPTGTVFIFQFLNPVLTNNGNCHSFNKYLSAILIGLCGFSCVLSSFTDSYAGNDGMIHYGVATMKGIWPTTNVAPSIDLSSYRVRFGDFVHSFFSLIVFAVLSLLDSSSVKCFYPGFESSEKTLLIVLPPVIGVISGTVFMLFPNKRHGIGYPPPPPSSEESPSP